jgi:hypothetical protein
MSVLPKKIRRYLAEARYDGFGGALADLERPNSNADAPGVNSDSPSELVNSNVYTLDYVKMGSAIRFPTGRLVPVLTEQNCDGRTFDGRTEVAEASGSRIQNAVEDSTTCLFSIHHWHHWHPDLPLYVTCMLPGIDLSSRPTGAFPSTRLKDGPRFPR